MARQEHEREDLLAEATALVERVEIAISGCRDHVVMGFRADGCGSVYFGQDEAFHFNTRNELRRAYYRGRLFKAHRGRLIALSRQRRADRVELVADDLDDARTAHFLQHFSTRVAELRAVLESGEYQCVGQVPPEGDVLARAKRWLAVLPTPPVIAARPHAR
jgi:hypothetical protein